MPEEKKRKTGEEVEDEQKVEEQDQEDTPEEEEEEEEDQIDDEGNVYFHLGNSKRVTLKKYKGKPFVDIREFYVEKSTGDMKPGRKGITLNVENWAAMLKLKDKIDKKMQSK